MRNVRKFKSILANFIDIGILFAFIEAKIFRDPLFGMKIFHDPLKKLQIFRGAQIHPALGGYIIYVSSLIGFV